MSAILQDGPDSLWRVHYVGGGGGDGHGLMRFVHPWRTNQGLWCACLAIHELGVGVLEAAGGGVSVK